jgi:transcriptional regulator of arginine metabolism
MSASGERYRRQEALLEILMDRRNIGSQTELQELLRARGIEATQSSVSRDLKDLGIKRVKGRYVLPPWRSVGEGDFKQVVGFVQSGVPAGPNIVVIVTSPSAARVVAWAIDSAGWPEVRGTVAGEDTLFVAVDDAEDQSTFLNRLKEYVGDWRRDDE